MLLSDSVFNLIGNIVDYHQYALNNQLYELVGGNEKNNIIDKVD